MAKKEKAKGKGKSFEVENDWQPDRNFTPIPTGRYIVQLVKSEVRINRSGTGRHLSCQFKIIKGDHQNRLIFHNFNMENQNEQAVDISTQQLKTLMKAVGVSSLSNGWEYPSELLGKDVEAQVRIEKGNDRYPDSNSINYFVISDKPKKEKKNKKKKKDKEWDQAPF